MSDEYTNGEPTHVPLSIWEPLPKLCDDCGRYEATVSLDQDGPPILCETCVKVALGILTAYGYDQEE